jgi:hypothetical protein
MVKTSPRARLSKASQPFLYAVEFSVRSNQPHLFRYHKGIWVSASHA